MTSSPFSHFLLSWFLFKRALAIYCEEGWVLKNWCFWTVVLEKTLESPLDCKEIQSVHPKGDQFWLFIGRTDVEAETPIFWPTDAKNWLIWKDPDAGKDWRQEKGMTEDEIFGWHHQPKGHEFEQALGVGDGQESPWRSRSQTGLSSQIELNRFNFTFNISVLLPKIKF